MWWVYLKKKKKITSHIYIYKRTHQHRKDITVAAQRPHFGEKKKRLVSENYWRNILFYFSYAVLWATLKPPPRKYHTNTCKYNNIRTYIRWCKQGDDGLTDLTGVRYDPKNDNHDVRRR